MTDSNQGDRQTQPSINLCSRRPLLGNVPSGGYPSWRWTIGLSLLLWVGASLGARAQSTNLLLPSTQTERASTSSYRYWRQQQASEAKPAPQNLRIQRPQANAAPPSELTPLEELTEAIQSIPIQVRPWGNGYSADVLRSNY